jgi:integrase
LEGDWGEALTAWLHRCPPEASIVPWPERRHVEALRGELGFWSPDVMRHTAASAHYARFADVGKAMKMLGHSGNSEVFHKHYKGLMTRAEAKAIYALRPG